MSHTLAAATPAINFNGLGQLLTPADGVLKVISLLLMAIMAAIWVMELSGHTISRHGIIRNNLKWNAKTIAVIAVSAAIYVALRPIEFQFVPGIGGFNPSLSLGPVIGILLGLPGVIGAAFSFPIGDSISGALTVGSLAGFFGQSYYMYFAYKIVGSHVPFNNWQAWVRLYVELIIGWVFIFVTISGWLDFTKLVPPLVAWGAVGLAIMINQLWVPAVLVPILVSALYPLVKAWGIFHGGLSEGEAGVTSAISMQQAAAAGAQGPGAH